MKLLVLSTLFLATASPLVVAFAPHHLSCRHQQQYQAASAPPSVAAHHHGRPAFVLFATTFAEIKLDVDDRMAKSIDSVRTNLNTIRTGRASPSILDRVKLDYYGVETPLNQMAGISVPSAQQLTIEPYDKSTLGAIEKAITEAELGLSPSNDGSVIRINIPALTEDRRKDMLKQCKALGEEGKVAVRNIRRDGVDSIKKMEKNGEISKDVSKDGVDAIQKITDKSIKAIDDIVAAKEKEVMKV